MFHANGERNKKKMKRAVTTDLVLTDLDSWAKMDIKQRKKDHKSPLKMGLCFVLVLFVQFFVFLPLSS